MSKRAGRAGGTWRKLAAHVKQTEHTCYRCGQPVDWTIPRRDEYGNDNPSSGTVEHIMPWSTHPELREDRANLSASHLKCNVSAGNRATRPSIGVQTQQW